MKAHFSVPSSDLIFIQQTDNMCLMNWTFSFPENSPRKKNLELAPSFEKIVDTIYKTMIVVCRHYEEGHADIKVGRIVYCAKIEKPLFDLFFNSRNGYRAWYVRSPKEGIQKNRYLIDTLQKKLIEFNTNEIIDTEIILNSLSGKSAKVWTAEVNKGLCSRCAVGWPGTRLKKKPEILNDEWEFSTRPYREYGIGAPYLEHIRILGAFFNDQGDEQITKPERAQEIHDCGWS